MGQRAIDSSKLAELDLKELEVYALRRSQSFLEAEACVGELYELFARLAAEVQAREPKPGKGRR